ncbi:uncharacterized protein LOC132204019 [Neocloeon triangulifer]|uniref:uncharacterized protein LOC132204019 n=1 Tax=Neocloeon triangulifer TaxID=2078957 RepID=UPI00286ECCA1|nr:uncharacterized protein LOC132204019 [Neocloeon triangulifer]
MNGSLEGSAQKGAIPKTKVATNGVPEQSSDNNNSTCSLYSDEEDKRCEEVRPRRSSSPLPSTSSALARPVTLNCTQSWVLEDLTSQPKDVERPPPECDTDLNVLPKQLLQDLCTLNGDCDICGRTTNGKYKSCHFNGDDRTDGEESDDEGDDDEEGAVGGEELLLEVLPIRSSPDSGEGELETHKSRSPSCSWDQQSLSSGDECFYRYRGEDDAPPLAEPLDNLPPKDEQRHRSSSPEMDYLEMDFDPSSDWGGDEVGPDEDQQQPEEVAQPPQNRQTPDVAPIPPVQEPPPTPPLAPVLRVPTRAPCLVTCGEVMIWSQGRAAELVQPSSNPLYAAANTIFYALSALGCDTSRESVVTFLSEAFPMQSVPQTVVGYLHYRACHSTLHPFAQTYPIFSGIDLARAFRTISLGRIRARFFPVLSRELLTSSLCKLITLWMSRGVIPIVTFSHASTDHSRHEMIFGANSNGIFTMAEPNHLQTEQALRLRLAEQGTTTVSHSDVLSRYSRDQNLQSLLHTTCLPWVTNNVLGTVVGILRAKSFSNQSPSPTSPGSSHHHQHPPLTFALPLLCVSGITLVYLSTNTFCSTIESLLSVGNLE